MHIVLVHVNVKTEFIEDFKLASSTNSINSRKEPGIARFDVIQNDEFPNRFILIEVYRTAQDPAKHKETDHYKKWKEVVEPMMAEPRQGVKFHNISPDDIGW
jgi:(4S)-4-hydroxy-5-phosphonooxypentane-2,3-dione isomerase